MSSTDAPHVGTCPEDSNMSPSSCKVTCTSDASCDTSKKCCQVATCGTRHCLDAVGGVTMGSRSFRSQFLYDDVVFV